MDRILTAVVAAGACVATLFGAERDPVVFSAGFNAEADEYDEKRMSGGIGGTTIRGELAYEVCDHFTVGLVLAFTVSASPESGGQCALTPPSMRIDTPHQCALTPPINAH